MFDAIMSDAIKSDAIKLDRRRFLGSAVAAASSLIYVGSALAQTGKALSVPAIKPGTNTSFGQIKQVDAGVLNVGYAEVGPAGGPPVVLLHGWPYDIHSYADVAPLLAQAGYRVIIRLCAATAPRASFRRTSCATASRRRSPWTSSR